MKPEDIPQLESSEMAKTAVKLLTEAINHPPLSKADYDYLLVTATHENSSRLGPIENVKMFSFTQAEYTESKQPLQ